MVNRKTVLGVTGVVALCLIGAYALLAQDSLSLPPGPGEHRPPMSFFVTSVPIGDGGNLGGLAGADSHCQRLAQAVGAGNKTWHAYLSTQASGNQPAVNARDRIGKGPWFNAKGVRIAKDLADLHGDTLPQARLGNNITMLTAVTEKGDIVPGAGDKNNVHDMLTGSQPDGRAYTDKKDHTCGSWTSNSTGNAQVGHHDRDGYSNISWNSSHASNGCGQKTLSPRGDSIGLYYCFAIN